MVAPEPGEYEPLLSAIEVGLVANTKHPYRSCNEGMGDKCFTCEAIGAAMALRAALSGSRDGSDV